MQTTIYKCDQCLKEIGAKFHISLRCERDSGIAVPPEMVVGNPHWGIHEKQQQRFLHFCDPAHLSLYFTAMIKRVKDKLNPPAPKKGVTK